MSAELAYLFLPEQLRYLSFAVFVICYDVLTPSVMARKQRSLPGLRGPAPRTRFALVPMVSIGGQQIYNTCPGAGVERRLEPALANVLGRLPRLPLAIAEDLSMSAAERDAEAANFAARFVPLHSVNFTAISRDPGGLAVWLADWWGGTDVPPIVRRLARNCDVMHAAWRKKQSDADRVAEGVQAGGGVIGPRTDDSDSGTSSSDDGEYEAGVRLGYGVERLEEPTAVEKRGMAAAAKNDAYAQAALTVVDTAFKGAPGNAGGGNGGGVAGPLGHSLRRPLQGDASARMQVLSALRKQFFILHTRVSIVHARLCILHSLVSILHTRVSIVRALFSIVHA